MLWSNSELIRNETQEELKQFMSKIMSSSYELIEEDFLHQDNRESDGNNANTLCIIIPIVVPNQTLQNMRHERLCCRQTFTSQE
jgi:hypothetical protein